MAMIQYIPDSPRRKDLTKQSPYGRLTVLFYAYTENSVPRWYCQCACGRTTVVRSTDLESGKTRSCGCRERYWRHGMASSPEYKAWVAMKQRCLTTYINGFENYGGRGITVCDRWMHSFEAFYHDMGPKPAPHFTLDRLDVNRGYEPVNCVWRTVQEQQQNKRTTVWITYAGVTKNLAQWCEFFRLSGQDATAFRSRLRIYGYSIDQALQTPLQRQKRSSILPMTAEVLQMFKDRLLSSQQSRD